MAEERVPNLGANLKVEGVTVSPIQSSPYIAPFRMKFQQVTIVTRVTTDLSVVVVVVVV